MRLVVDASAWLEILCPRHDGDSTLDFVLDENAEIHVPALCDIEVVSGLRRLTLREEISLARADMALDAFVDVARFTHDHELWLRRIIDLRQRFSSHDAAYVALAESLEAILVTVDRPLARSAAAIGVAVLP